MPSIISTSSRKHETISPSTSMPSVSQPSKPPASPLPEAGELTPALIKQAFGAGLPEVYPPCEDLPPRPPSLCAGCPHRLVFTVLRDMKAVVSGDIGCYTLGATPPLSAVHSTIDMGASLSVAHGLELADVTGAPSAPLLASSGTAPSRIRASRACSVPSTTPGWARCAYSIIAPRP